MAHSAEFVLDLTREVDAPRDAVFRACIEPAELAKWWGPRGFTAQAVELDPRVGGAYRLAMQPPEGDVFYLGGEFREVEPPSSLAYTFDYEEPDPDDVETLVTLTFRDLGGSTEVTLHQGDFATEGRLELHEQGWSDTLDRLEELFASR
ncbi:MAG TPA: SRPBCC domain-containing protein [Solirubrobacterales bacterium]|jgi:uncharacterized protein YndB with AHSA1/START domain